MPTALEMVMRRTGLSAEDASYYVTLAEARVRSYLGLRNNANIDDYVMQVADIAVLYWQRDTSDVNSGASLGYSSERFQEGQMSETHTTMTGSAIWATYERSILEVLHTIGQDEKTAGLAVMY